MERPKLKDYQTKAFHHFDTEKYANDLNKYIDYLEKKSLPVINRELLVKFANYCNSFNIENNNIQEEDVDSFIDNQKLQSDGENRNKIIRGNFKNRLQ